MKKLLIPILSLAVIVSGCNNANKSKTIEYGFEGVVKNGTVDTRVGSLSFENGYPSRESVEKLFDVMDFQRATQAYIWALPTVSFAQWQYQHENEFGVNDGEFVLFDELQELDGILTANKTTPYAVGFINLEKNGPTIVNVPPGPVGGLVNDAWQRPVADLGLAGPDKGKGGKYLFLGPGQSKPKNLEVDYIFMSKTNNILFGIRILTPDVQMGKDMLNAFKTYPYDKPSKKSGLCEITGKVNQYQPRGLTFWERLHWMVQREPVADRDRFMIASLKFLGIEKGKPFNPDQRQKNLLKEASFVGEAMAQANSFESRFPGVSYRNDASWEYVIFLDPSQRVGEVEELDERAAYTYEAMTTSRGMTTKTPGVGSAYLGGYRDSEGNWLKGSNTYKMKVPANAPMKQFWSVTVYNQHKRCLIDNGTGRADRSSRHDLIKNDDGSVDLYFGPDNAPDGMEKNFVKTNKGEGFFVYLRLYAPTEPYFEKSWALPDLELVK